jgi:uncharacterized protein
MSSYFVYKLVPSRPAFAADMTDAEAAVMGEHFAYWQALLSRGTAVMYGLVADPAGTWGLAVVEADTPDEVRALGGCRSGRGVRHVVVRGPCHVHAIVRP